VDGPSAVRGASDGYRGGMTRVLIAVDGTSSDRIIVNSAHKLFGDDAEYVLINVRRDPMMIAATTVGVGMASMVPTVDLRTEYLGNEGDTLQSEADLATGTARAAAAAADLDDAVVVGEIGLEPDAILHAADEYQVDVIVVGDHDRNWFSKMMSPSVTEAVTDRADVPVLVIRIPKH
jgi:nucleotide-binding universal stress UspA family protein